MSTDFFDVVRRQRACRLFADTPVSEETIARILTAATFAPSAENKQPWEFIVVRDPSLRERIGELTKRAWESHGRTFSEHRLSPAMLADVDGGATGGVAGAPVNIVVCADTERGLAATVDTSILPAVQNILLAATALGLGSALTTITTTYRKELQQLMSLPEHVWPVAIVPVGHPARPLGKPRREPFAAHTHRDLYGLRW
jgi:nitroreductase